MVYIHTLFNAYNYVHTGNAVTFTLTQLIHQSYSTKLVQDLNHSNQCYGGDQDWKYCGYSRIRTHTLCHCRASILTIRISRCNHHVHTNLSMKLVA